MEYDECMLSDLEMDLNTDMHEELHKSEKDENHYNNREIFKCLFLL